MRTKYSRREFIKKTALGIGAVAATNCLFAKKKDRPNILWLVSEDNSASFISCYGNKQATTPNIDKLAAQGIRYTNAFANAPVCAPMRHSIITGMYASTTGCHNMRSTYPVPNEFKFFPQYLREAGYYCTNNDKEDYNTIKPENVWDESSNTAHFKNRKSGQPFFAIFNTNTSHEHKIHLDRKIPKDELQHDPNSLELAPYHPDLPEIRHTYATYYDYITKMDAEIGKAVKKLEDAGLADDTIVFYYSDHGGVLPGSKRFINEPGTRIPFIVQFPEKYKHLALGKAGLDSDRIITLVDLAPTLFSLIGIDIPKRFQGNAFLGNAKSNDPGYAYFFRNRMDERYDMMRAVRDKKYRYIRNYQPNRKYGQHLWYLWRSEATRAWQKHYEDGNCNEIQSRFWETKVPEELYDCENDPHNINNLAKDPKYKEVLDRLREENKKQVRRNQDAGFLPEGMMIEFAKDSTIYEMKQTLPMDRIIETAETATIMDEKQIPELIKRLSDSEPAVRYWAAYGCAVLPEKSKSALPKLKELMKDEFDDVRIAACEALCRMGYKKKSLNLLVQEMENDNPKIQLHALNVLDALEDDTKLVLKNIIGWLPWSKKTDEYFHQALTQLIKKLKPGWEDYIVW